MSFCFDTFLPFLIALLTSSCSLKMTQEREKNWKNFIVMWGGGRRAPLGIKEVVCCKKCVHAMEGVLLNDWGWVDGNAYTLNGCVTSVDRFFHFKGSSNTFLDWMSFSVGLQKANTVSIFLFFHFVNFQVRSTPKRPRFWLNIYYALSLFKFIEWSLRLAFPILSDW
jgi:hypothetical protein